MPRFMDKPALFLTNDDGVEADGLQVLIKELHTQGYPIVVLAPASEQSCSGMRLTLDNKLELEEREDIADSIKVSNGPPLRIFSLGGTPCDCAIVAIDGGLNAWTPEIRPTMCISGINQGPNLSVDVLHSGTVSAAREASLYGMPSIALSLATYEHSNFEESLSGMISIIDACASKLPRSPANLGRPEGSKRIPKGSDMNQLVMSAFANGDLILNVNSPRKWNGSIQTVRLGCRWYRNAIDIRDIEKYDVGFKVGASKIVEEDITETDCNAINSGSVSVTPLSSWPINHPLGMSPELMEAATRSSSTGLPAWLH